MSVRLDRGRLELDALAEQGRAYLAVEPIDVGKILHLTFLFDHGSKVGEMDRQKPFQRQSNSLNANAYDFWLIPNLPDCAGPRVSIKRLSALTLSAGLK